MEGGLKVDAEQLESFEKIRNLLVAGGYFRAMIKTLDHFDKVAGGLAWSITASNENVDVNLLFEEHSRMGEKITMSEAIERTLVDMECPHPLQAQQILHLDCIKIFPVVQWLVSKVIEVRKQTGDLVRIHSENQFHNFGYDLPSDVAYEQAKPNGLEYMSKVSTTYAPKRYQRVKARRGLRSQRAAKAAEAESVHSVLLEYGQAHLYTMALLHKEKSAETNEKKKPNLKLPGGAVLSEEEEALRAAQSAKETEIKLLSYMGKITSGGNIAKTALADMMRAKSAEVKDARDTVAEELKEAEQLQSQANEKEHGGFNHQRYIADIEKKIEKGKKKLAKLQAAYQEKQSELKSIQEALNKKLDFNKKIIEETDKLNSLEQTPENKKYQVILQELVSLNMNLRDQIKIFKESGNKELEEWNTKIANLKKSTPDDGGRGEEILKTHASDTVKLDKLREALALKNRQIVSVKRKIDQVPSRRELQQYQKQFVEVFEQMGIKHTETKQYINSFNSSEKIRAALEHESKILDSIQEKYPPLKNSKTGRDKFLASLTEILQGMEKRLEQQKKLVEDEISRRNKLDDEYTVLVEKERKYYVSAKQYQEECKKTETLEDNLKKYQKRKK
uniref:Uncharacterized protein n=1 Tax=Arcella intermedia TaxID=1963864 RepID=A0A6B2L016_9EUKA|eukprot:TRINITY_DN8200_c0_g1_i1.p1 TRINITY_DN8200_c0_g1~~TRINITY_DN8200_c0_g1_i1.p1  ORF type:complete len:631 (-),score=218.39 TRINITY_DN8200_c0_g1_i1:37-1890(-)